MPTDAMLTTSIPVKPSTITAPGGIAAIEDTLIAPIAAWRDSGMLIATDFTHLVLTWQTSFGSRAFLYDERAVAGVDPAGPVPPGIALGPCSPNPFTSEMVVRLSVPRATRVRVAVFDILGRRRAVLADGPRAPGSYAIRWEARGLENGMYFRRAQEVDLVGGPGCVVCRKVVIRR